MESACEKQTASEVSRRCQVDGHVCKWAANGVQTRGIMRNNLNRLDARFPLNRFTAVPACPARANRRNLQTINLRADQDLNALPSPTESKPMQPTESMPVIAHAIQLAVAPVFLLTGIAALLGVMATRLARIIDRARYYEQRWKEMDEGARESAHGELADLEQRRHLASWAINFSTFAALLVCIVIATLFVDAFFDTDLKWIAGVLFIGAMVALIGGLACFLREVYVATQTVRIMTAKFLQ